MLKCILIKGEPWHGFEREVKIDGESKERFYIQEIARPWVCFWVAKNRIQWQIVEDDMEVIESKVLNTETIDDTFLLKIERIKKSMYEKKQEISGRITPNNMRKKMGDSSKKINWNDIEFIPEHFMRDILSKEFIWSWDGCGSQPLQVHERIGTISFTGTLSIMDNGIKRTFTSCGGSAIKIKSGQSPTPENLVNFDNDVKAANTQALKKAINMLTHIGDDVYRKQMISKTNPNTLKEMKNLFNDLENEDTKLSIERYINDTYNGWESIDEESCKAIKVNLIEHVKFELNKKENQS